VRAEVIALACALPAEHGVPLSRWSAQELAREAITRGICEQISGVTVWRWLSEDAIKPWQHRSWIFPRDPRFAQKANPILDLYAGRWQGERLHPGDYVICADEKPSIQARARRHLTLPAARAIGRGQRVEHEYERKGSLCYLAAWDARHAKIFDRCAAKDGIEPSDALIDQPMSQHPYNRAQRVFLVIDNGSAHRGQRSIDRLQGTWPNLTVVHTPIHASWLNQAEIYLSVVQRKILTPTTSKTSTRSKPSYWPSAAATSRSPRPSSGSSPATTFTSSSPRPAPSSRQRAPPDTCANFRARALRWRRVRADVVPIRGIRGSGRVALLLVVQLGGTASRRIDGARTCNRRRCVDGRAARPGLCSIGLG